MSLEMPITEFQSQEVALEECNDSLVSANQIDALLEADISVTKARAQIGGATVRYTQLINERLADPTPIVIANGFCGTEGAYKPLAVEIALRGRNVVYLEPPRSQAICGLIKEEHFENVLLLQQQSIWVAGRESVKAVDCDQFDLFGHSLGGKTSTGVAMHKAERVRNIMLAAPTGLDGRNKLRHRITVLPQVALYDIGGGINAIRENSGNGLAVETAGHVLKRPIRTFREGVAAARADIRKDVDELRNRGVRIGLTLFANDGIFNTDHVLHANRARNFDAPIRIIPNARHAYPQEQPVEHSYDVHNMLGDLEDGWQFSIGA